MPNRCANSGHGSQRDLGAKSVQKRTRCQSCKAAVLSQKLSLRPLSHSLPAIQTASSIKPAADAPNTSIRTKSRYRHKYITRCYSASSIPTLASTGHG